MAGAIEARTFDRHRRLEHIVGDGCAPVILGVKPSNLVAVDTSELTDGEGWLFACRAMFAKTGIASCILGKRKSRSLVLFYRPTMLMYALSGDEARRILRDHGYKGSLGAMLERLRARIGEGEAFPHEIGLFLGYPARDVAAFIENGGRGGIMCGYWRVYHDAGAAGRSFRIYDKCRDCIARMMVKEGQSLSNILTYGGKNNDSIGNLLVGNG